MKDVLKLTTVTGEALYLRDTYSVSAVASVTQGDQKFTEIVMMGYAFSVRESAENVASLLGWEPKKVTDTSTEATP